MAGGAVNVEGRGWSMLCWDSVYCCGVEVGERWSMDMWVRCPKYGVVWD